MRGNGIKHWLLLGLLAVGPASAEPQIYQLENNQLHFSFTPQLGGRGLAFAAAGQENLLKVGAAVQQQPQPQPPISADGDNIPYLGHIVWLGPQKAWWRHQSLNTARRDAGADWPPDPFTVLAGNTLTKLSDTEVEMIAPASPVSGLSLHKQFVLDGDRLVQRVEATNQRETPVSWDLWFNTRVPADTRVYVPVKDFDNDLRIVPMSESVAGPDESRQAGGFFDFARIGSNKAKAYIQPAAGWLAAFNKGQVFIIEFPLQPRAAIHPDQGQVELYLEYADGEMAEGLLELEVHAPFKTLESGGSMSAQETWRALPYSGNSDMASQTAFLQELGYTAP
ncbi:DUF4380 domain-containing protein [Microbulbifer hainanensis]|uniref:DUF4380 domain-containing protein n=1 Tax=Microbulbifer hainanensis TaxID=2735675 RepID=UPI00186734A6|nr:DUF4380 domain-containing protein [Microbulbifer hainanensis]